jgi:hypothetical protein
MIAPQGIERFKGCINPMSRLLFGKAGMWGSGHQRSASACDQALLVIDQNDFDR